MDIQVANTHTNLWRKPIQSFPAVFIMASKNFINPLHPDMTPKLDDAFVNYYHENYCALRLEAHQAPLNKVRAEPWFLPAN